MLSPVWMPAGSRFSIEQMIIQLSLESRMTSISISFQPATDFSTSTCPIALFSMPIFTCSLSSESLEAKPPPVPPSVYAGLIMTGYPASSTKALASSYDVAMQLPGIGSPISCIRSLNASRSSALWMLSLFTPRSLTPYFWNTPLASSSMPRLSPV